MVLLRVMMRRAGVGPWMATLMAGTFVLFGVSYENMLLAIQISMVGSMVFGIAQLLLSDHDGPFGRRDVLGLVCGLVALMASSIGVITVLAVGVAVLIRRGWRTALLCTAPLGTVYVPALAVGAAAVVRRWRFSAPLVVVLLLAGVPGNIAVFDERGPAFTATGFEQMRRVVLAVPASSVARAVPGDVHPNPNELTTANVTVGFLLQAAEDGRIPTIDDLSTAEEQRIVTRLSISQNLVADPDPEGSCTTTSTPIAVTAERGDRFLLGSAVRISLEDGEGRPTAPTGYTPVWSGSTLTANLGGLTFEVGPAPPATTFTWCTVA